MSTPRSPRSEILGAATAGLIVVFFCLLLLWHDPLVFWNDDYELSVLPVLADIARSWSEGHWPILSPYSWVCGNLACEFQYGTFSQFVNALVVLVWKFPLAFPQQAAALSIAHLFVLAIGSVRSAHSLGCHGRGGERNALWIREEPNGDSSGRRHSFISSLRADFPTRFYCCCSSLRGCRSSHCSILAT